MSTVEYDITNTADLQQAEEAMRMGELENMRPLPRISVHAFCESEELQRVMERCGNDRRLSKVSLRITSGGIAAAANMFASAPTPNLIILETRASSAGDAMFTSTPTALTQSSTTASSERARRV